MVEQVSMRRRSRLLPIGAIVLCFGCGPDAGKNSNLEGSTKSTSYYFDVGKCWHIASEQRGRASFVGAVAFYKVERGYYAAVFSGLCDTPVALVSEMGDQTLRVNVRYVSSQQPRVSSPSIFEIAPLVDLSDQELGNIGLSPQWPERMYAVSGKIELLSRNGAKIDKVSKIAVHNAQEMPREVVGQFMEFPSRRRQMIEYYLTATGLDERGYKAFLM